MRKINKNSALFAMALMLAVFISNVACGQLFTPYTVTRTTGITYSTIRGTGGETHFLQYPNSSGWRCSGCTYNITDDNQTGTNSIGFNFNFDNQTVTSFQVSTNGFMALNSNGYSGGAPVGGPYGFVNSEFYTSGGTAMSICPFYQDLITYGNPNTTGSLDTCIIYSVTGTSPNRILTVEWRYMQFYAVNLANLNFQIKLYESSSNIEFDYGTMTPGGGSISYAEGFNSNTYGTTTTYRLDQTTQNSATFGSGANYMGTVPASNTRILFSRINTDLGAFAVSPPIAGQCTYSSSQVVVDSIKNYGTTTYNFSNNPDTIVTQITGAITQTFTTIINSGTLAPGAAMGDTIGTINMSAGGIYNFKVYNSNYNDQNHSNDTTYTSFTIGEVTASATTSATICNGGNCHLLATTPGFGHVFPVSYAPYTMTSPTTISLGDDAYTYVVMPFHLNFFCSSFDTLYLTDDGNIQFSSAYTGVLNNLFPDVNYPTNVIAYAWSDLNNPASGTYSYQTFGTAPYRKFVLNLSNVSVANIAGTITTQVILYETTNLIEFHESSVPLHNYTQGIEDATGTLGYTTPNRNDLSWSATTDAYQFTSCPNYSWSPGATLDDSLSATPIATPIVTTTYTVTLNPGSACTQTATVTVTVGNSMGNISPIQGDSILCTYTTTSFKIPAVTNATSYIWDNSNLLGSTITTGQGTDSITLNVGGTNGGILKVRAYNSSCNAYSAWVTIYILLIPDVYSSTDQWVGGVSTNWFDANNWCGGVPTSTTSGDIDGYLGGNYGYYENFPVINGSGAVTQDMILEGDFDSLTIAGSYNLDVYGNWYMALTDNVATFIPNNSTVSFKGSTYTVIDNPNLSSLSLPFYNLTINKGSNTTSIVEDFDGMPISVAGNLSLINGMLTVDEPTSTVQFSSAPTISATAGLDLNGGVLTSGNYNITNYGTFLMDVNSSDITIGTTSGNSITTTGSSGLLKVIGGNLTVAGQIIVANGATFNFDETNATFAYSTSTQVEVGSVGLNSNTAATLDIDATSNFDFEQGNIFFVNPNAGSADDFKVGNGGSKTIGGGNTMQFGTSASPSDAYFKVIDSVVAFNNLIINPTSGARDTLRLDGPATINSSAILYLNSNIIKLNKYLLTLQNTTGSFSSSLTNLNGGALQRSSGGFIISEDTLNRAAIKWSMTNTNQYYIFPFGNTYGGYVPFSFKNTSTGTTTVKVSTYAPPTNTALHKPYPSSPIAVTHLHLATTGADNSANVVNRFWEIDTSATTGTVTGAVRFVISNLSGHNEEPSNNWTVGGVAQRWGGSGWYTPTSSAPTQSYAGDTVSASGIIHFSPWTISRTGSPLPIELLYFTAKYNGTDVDLNWSTASEINNNYFTVSKTKDAEEFDWVATVQGAGNSNTQLYYSAIDPNPYIGTSYYQLTQTDYDGNATKSDLVPVIVGENGFEILKVYADINGIINISINDNSNENLTVTVFDILGNKIANQNVSAITGGNYIQIKPENLSQGVYFIAISNNSKRLTTKLVY